ncbi:MAG TPA: transglutaminase domain-containing protein [Dehalococcoidia bacterium]|nr:transglutaminase domain-containing protein [Dehalococcoidia bacterium]
MRQASWNEIFRGREREVELPPKPSRFEPILRFSRYTGLTWETLITLAIVLVGFLTVVRSIDSADWVPGMPSLYGIGFLGLMLGLAAAHSRVPALAAHLFALGVCVVAGLYVIGNELRGSLRERTWEILERLWLWGDAVVTGGISNDDIPFIVLVVAATFVAAYVAAWSIFRWYNAWVGLIPGGLALMTNISYLPGQHSLPLLIYLFCAILLVARVNLLRHAREWRLRNIRYPDFMSLTVLNITVWVAIPLLALAWVLPVGSGSGLLYSAWTKVTSPIAAPLNDLGRVFSGIDSKKGSQVHLFGSTLPLQGPIKLSSSEVLRATTSEVGFLRVQVYDEYTPAGWKVGESAQITQNSWPALEPMQPTLDTLDQLRRAVSLQVTTSKDSNVIVTAGQPLAVNIDTRVVFGPGPADVTSVRPASKLGDEDNYRVDGTVSDASVTTLRSIESEYPNWTEAYLQLPGDLPQRVRDKALEVVDSVGALTAYDKAAAIEQYLRSFGINLRIPAAGPREDSVDYFLFEAQEGYFDYHASAMVVMLRSLGIPSRIAVGYVIRSGDRVPNTNIYRVSESNSFAWPEVYFPGLGWVEFNPTPSDALVARSFSDDGFFPSDGIDEEFIDDAFFLPAGVERGLGAPDELDALVIEEESDFVSTVTLSAILGVVALMLLGAGVFQYSWQHGLGRYSYPVQVWEKTLRLARWSRIRPRPQETPREVIARLHQALPDVEDLDFLGESYIKTRYGQKELSDEERERLKGVWGQARNTLLARLLRWK